MSQMAVVNPKQQAQASLRTMLEKIGPAMSAVLPKHVTPERMIKIALSATNRMPALLDCDAKSIIQAVMLGAELGLEAGGILGEAYLVPYKGKVQLIVGYRGLVKLAMQSGEIEDIEARAVYERDFFEFEYGLDQKLRHVPTRESDPGKLIYVYSLARLKTGRHFDVMTVAEVEKIKNRSPSGRSGPWVSDYAEMAKKTVVRRLCKMIPMSAERINRALELSDKADAIHSADIDISAGMADEEAPSAQMTQGDALKAKLESNERETVTVPADPPSKPGREPGQEGLP